MSKKVNWAQADKRIRGRRKDFSDIETAAVEAELKQLPDLAEEAEIITIPQPAVTEEEPAEEEAAVAPEGETTEAPN